MDRFLTAEASISSLPAATIVAVVLLQPRERFARYLLASAGAPW